ncbi:DNA-processing protein DprA [Oecophyllibacter saccharovorans]|uniref:DNA-protecting protein DprA n=1 Tax=Oecophyllibacter saccharovorans TaxID=2558360 RepID=A0A506ULS7_9PROT|nr:DNA-processing protein DprA [Oecophyllibacter saccharovorans]TPW34278.1 DNA-protecting protein DprA [Oecophyllibacter saccharovorans]
MNKVPPPSQERLALLRLARTPGIGPMNFSRLLGLYGSGIQALEAWPARQKRAGHEAPAIPSAAEMEDEIAALQKTGARHLLRCDADYPLLLTHVPDAPPLLFIRGDSALLSRGGVGIVGARNASAAGIRLAESLSAELAAAGQCVVSGLARGIDTAAHEAALYPGLTVAALAGGLDQVYPPENAALQEQIAEKGCLITEAPPGTVPQARHFPRRNRLIAGIAAATLVIEAAQKSGTLITARLATEYDRVVMAVPGTPLDPRSRGGNQLIKQGAVMVETGTDILQALPQHLPHRQPAPWQRRTPAPLFEQPERTDQAARPEKIPAPQPARPHMVAARQPASSPAPAAEPQPPLPLRDRLLDLLSHTPIAVDEVVTRCQFSVAAVTAALGELEMEGLISCLPGGQVVRLPDEA